MALPAYAPDHTNLPAERSLWVLRDARYGKTSRRMAN